MKRLLVMRHGKSDWQTGAADHDRPLNARGLRSADTMGALLAEIGEVPDHAFSSTAERARTTLEVAAAAGQWPTTIELRSELYTTSPAGTLEVVATAPDVESVMVVGHMPTWADLVHELTGASVLMATATVVGIDLAIDDWADAPEATGQLAWVLQPRHFLARGQR